MCSISGESLVNVEVNISRFYPECNPCRFSEFIFSLWDMFLLVTYHEKDTLKRTIEIEIPQHIHNYNVIMH